MRDGGDRALLGFGIPSTIPPPTAILVPFGARVGSGAEGRDIYIGVYCCFVLLLFVV